MKKQAYEEIEDVAPGASPPSRPLRTKNAGGRPPKAIEDKATKLTVYVTEGERVKVNARAVELGITASGLVRMLLKEKQVI
jgi:hypothetical protein